MVERRVRSRDAVHPLPLQLNLDVPLAEFQRPANAVGSQLPLTPVLVEGADRHVQASGGLAYAYQPVAAAESRCPTGGCQGLHGEPLVLEILQRKLIVPEAAAGVARFSFDALCGDALGAADYVELAKHFHTILIDRIPQLGPEQANEARRFTLLIDTLYDEKVKLICSAAARPQELYVEGDNAPAFRRAVSRLMEMQSADYLRVGPGTRAIAAGGLTPR